MCEVTTTRLDRGVVLKVMKLDERVIQRWPCRGRWVGLGLRCRHATCAVMGLGRSSTLPSQPSLADYVIIKFRPIEASLLTASTPTDSDYRLGLLYNISWPTLFLQAAACKHCCSVFKCQFPSI